MSPTRLDSHSLWHQIDRRPRSLSHLKTNLYSLGYTPLYSNLITITNTIENGALFQLNLEIFPAAAESSRSPTLTRDTGPLDAWSSDAVGRRIIAVASRGHAPRAGYSEDRTRRIDFFVKLI